MKFLLDTHVLLWWMNNSRELPRETQGLIADRENAVFVSTVALWEIWLKESLGKLAVPANFNEKVSEQGFTMLPLAAAHTRAVARLPWHHRDPFDRMLIAQAQVEGLTLLTADAKARAYGKMVRVMR